MDTDQTIREIIPRLRKIAPQTFWFSVAFATFNTVVGISLLNVSILVRLQIVGVVPLKLWAAIFLAHGLFMAYSLFINHYRFTLGANVFGLAIKTAWWFELVAEAVVFHTLFFLEIWSLLWFLQFIVCLYFTPKVVSHGK